MYTYFFFLTIGSYEARVNDINEIGEKVDHILENKAIDGVKVIFKKSKNFFFSQINDTVFQMSLFPLE